MPQGPGGRATVIRAPTASERIANAIKSKAEEPAPKGRLLGGSNASMRAPTISERINNALRGIYEGMAAQPLGQISDLLGMSDLGGIAKNWSTPDTGVKMGIMPSGPGKGLGKSLINPSKELETIYRGGNLAGQRGTSYWTTIPEEAAGYASLSSRPEARILNIAEVPKGQYTNPLKTDMGNIPETWANEHRAIPNEEVENIIKNWRQEKVPEQVSRSHPNYPEWDKYLNERFPPPPPANRVGPSIPIDEWGNPTRMTDQFPGVAANAQTQAANQGRRSFEEGLRNLSIDPDQDLKNLLQHEMNKSKAFGAGDIEDTKNMFAQMLDDARFSQAKPVGSGTSINRIGPSVPVEPSIPASTKPNPYQRASGYVNPTPATPNASGESMASMEAINRMASMKGKGQQFVVRKGGTTRPLIGPEAVDYRPRPGEEYGIMENGVFKLLQRGGGR